MTGTSTETFFLPDELERFSTSIPAELYNLAHTLLARSEPGCVFVPIRSMQYLGVITQDEIVFVDSLAYVCEQDEGGRLIMVAWRCGGAAGRESLVEPVDCEVILYHPDSAEIQKRLIGDFHRALLQLDRRFRDDNVSCGGARILRLG